MNREQLIAKMRGRIEMCRRLAQSTTDQRTAETLRQMANEGERDLAELMARPVSEPAEIEIKPEAPPAG
jgi:hypothetical protein